MAIDHSCLTDEIEYFDPLNESQKERARRTVAANAIDATDAANLMMALGIHPSQKDDEVDERTRPMPPRLHNMTPR